MSTSDLLVLVGAIASTIAAVSATLTIWLNRSRQPFTLESVNAATMRLTRTRWPSVYIHEVFVLCHGPLVSVDRAATLKGRVLTSHQQVLVDVSGIPVGESVAVRYSRHWSLRSSPSRKRLSKLAKSAEAGKWWGGLRV